MISKFKKSQDYIDILYMINHISDIDILESILKELGYRVGTLIIKNDLGIGRIIIDKKKEIRMQITKKYNNINIARCVIIDPKKLFFQNG